MAPVSLVVVSHSSSLAAGVAELAGAMAADVHIGVAGGLPDGGLGTSFDLAESAVNDALEASEGAGVVILTDLGSATMTVDMILDFADEPEKLLFADGPLVEGAVAAAVAAQQGGDLQAVVAAVKDAAQQWGTAPSPPASDEGTDAEDARNASAESPQITVEATVADAAGLHARPAAKLAALAGDFEAEVFINDASAASMIEIMSLGAHQGDKVIVSAEGEDANEAANAVATAISAGLDK